MQDADADVPAHLSMDFKRHNNRMNYAVETWAAPLRAHTFRTELVPITFDEARALVFCVKRHLAATSPDQVGPRVSPPEEDKEDAPDYGQILQRLEKRLEVVAKRFPTGFFAKLNTRSAKDAPIYGFRAKELEASIVEGLNRLDATPGTRNPNTETAVYCSALNQCMCLYTGAHILEMFMHSFRVPEDLLGAMKFGREHFEVSVVLREWDPRVPAAPECEFRGFVYGRRLNALTQYFTCCYYPELVAQKGSILSRIQTFFDEIAQLLPEENCVIDFAVLPDRVMVIELNPFYTGAGPGLFSWARDKQLFMEGPKRGERCELRIVEQCPPAEESKRFVHPRWQALIDAHRGGRRTKLQRPRQQDTSMVVPLALLITVLLLCGFAIWISLSGRRYFDERMAFLTGMLGGPPVNADEFS